MAVNKVVHVKRSPEDAFRLFVDEMGKWWPLHTGKYSYDAARAQDVFLEARVGGRFYERYKDGDEFQIEHRNIENMGEMAHGFDEGWDDVLGYFVRAADAGK